MHGEAQPCREVAEQAEAVARLDDEQARPIDRRHLIQDVVERRALARTRGAEQEQMRVHLPVEAVQRIEGDRTAAAVEERDARMPVPWLRPQTGARFAACCANMSWVYHWRLSAAGSNTHGSQRR